MLLLFLIQLTQSINYEDVILFHWKGNLTENSITLKIFPKQNLIYPYRIILWENINFQSFQLIIPLNINDYPNQLIITQLKSDTLYNYYFEFYEKNITLHDIQNIYELEKNYEFKSQLIQPIFRFQTIGILGQPYSFNFSASACARSASESQIFIDILKTTNPQFFFMLGDLHYRDINTESIDEFQFAYTQVFNSLTQRYLYQQVPFEYQFDDHDFGKNDADGTSPTRKLANYMYYQYVPHNNFHNYQPLFSIEESQYFPKEISNIQEIDENNIGTYRFKLIGRTIIITLDLRTFQNLEILGEDFPLYINKFSLLGKKQRTWLNQILTKIQELSWIKVIILISSVNFHGEIWNNFPQEQLLVADQLSFLQEEFKKQVLIVSSDSHMTAMKNGFDSFIQDLNKKYKYGLQETMCGSLDKPGSCKTQPLTYGPWLGKNHYSNIQIIDQDNQTCIIIRGYENTDQLFQYNTCNEQQRQLKGVNKCPFDILFRVAYVLSSLIVSLIIIGLLYYIVYRSHQRYKTYIQL